MSFGVVLRKYYEAKMETTNISQSIIQDIKRGYIMEAKGDRKAKKSRRYTVTVLRRLDRTRLFPGA